MQVRLASIPLALACLFCGSAVLAGEVAGFTALSACRIDAEQVLLRASFEGGACQKVEPAELGEPDGKTLAVTLPSTRTAEICTMQIVPIAVEQAIAASGDIAELDVTALDPDGRDAAHGVVDIGEGDADCVAPQG